VIQGVLQGALGVLLAVGITYLLYLSLVQAAQGSLLVEVWKMEFVFLSPLTIAAFCMRTVNGNVRQLCYAGAV